MCSNRPAANMHKTTLYKLSSRKLRCNFSMLFYKPHHKPPRRPGKTRPCDPSIFSLARRLPLPTDANLTVISMFTLCSVLLGGGVRVQKGAASKSGSPIATGNELT